MRIAKAAILATGDEIRDGTVVDTDRPAIARLIRRAFAGCTVLCPPALHDSVTGIVRALELGLAQGCDLIIAVGGSGGGHECDPDLARDCTHVALERVLPHPARRDLQGMNGHLWARLVVGQCGRAWLVNVPGPYVEAVAAAEAVLCFLARHTPVDSELLADAVADAVLGQYPVRAGCAASPWPSVTRQPAASEGGE